MGGYYSSCRWLKLDLRYVSRALISFSSIHFAAPPGSHDRGGGAVCQGARLDILGDLSEDRAQRRGCE